MGTSQTRLAYIAESAWGTTPSSPAFSTGRMTGESLKPNINNVVSDEIRADRNIPDLVQVGSSAGGDINFELSYGGMFDDLFESLLFSTWSTNVLKNGVTQKSFTFEKTFETGSTDQYHRFAGSVVDSMELSMAVEQIVTGKFGILSKGMTSAQAAIASSSYGAAGANPVINAAANFASLAITGATSPTLLKLDLMIKNNLAQQKQLGSLSARGLSNGRFEVTGKLEAYFENQELMDLFLAGTAADLTFKLGGSSSKNYLFNIPNLKFKTGEVLAGGNDQDLILPMEFQGLYYASDANTIKITRTP